MLRRTIQSNLVSKGCSSSPDPTNLSSGPFAVHLRFFIVCVADTESRHKKNKIEFKTICLPIAKEKMEQSEKGKEVRDDARVC
jgi:hypothetical protein